MAPDIDILCSMTATTAISVPTVTDIPQVSTLAEINARMNGITTIYKPRNFIPITPFLYYNICEIIIESQGDCKLTLLKVIQCMLSTPRQKPEQSKERSYQGKQQSAAVVELETTSSR